MYNLKHKYINKAAIVSVFIIFGALLASGSVFAAPATRSGDTFSDHKTINCPTEYNGQPVPKEDQNKPVGDSSDGACGTSDLAAADNATCQSDSNCQNIFDKYLTPLIKFLSAAVGIVVVGAVIFGGIQFSASGGDPQKVANAKKHITNALIALVAYLLLFAFLNFIIPGGLLSDPPSTKTKNVNTPGMSNTSGAIDSSSGTTTQNNSSGSFTGGGGGSF